MSNELYLSQNLKWNNRNRIFNKIREIGRASSTILSYELQLIWPTRIRLMQRKKWLLDETVAGVGIAVPGLITEDHQQIFYGKILGFTGITAKKMGKYIPYRCYLYNDADAAGYAEVSSRKDIADAFYICLSNNIGGSVLINHQVYKGEGPRSGEVGHMTIVLDGNECYCGQKGCFETYCNATILSDLFEGDLDMFFEKLEEGNKVCEKVWDEYLHYLAIAANNVRMLFDCKVKREALALGSALPFIHELWNTI